MKYGGALVQGLIKYKSRVNEEIKLANWYQEIKYFRR